MASSALILFGRDGKETISQFLENGRGVCAENDLHFLSIDSDSITDAENNLIRTEFMYSDISFDESTSRPCVVIIYNKVDKFHMFVNFDWYNNGEELSRSLMVESIHDREDLLFKFVYPFFQNYPEAKLWVSGDWFYTLSDLEKIASQYTDDWCYKSPKSLL